MAFFDILSVIFFAMHIPTTILVDSQSVLPSSWFPQAVKDVLAWHIEMNQDHLVRDNPTWFVAFVWGELLLQLPFFFVATYAFATRKKWIRIPAMIYGAHTATTLVPILADILFGPQSGAHSIKLALIYSAYFFYPLFLTLRMAFMADPFPERKSKKPKRK